ncbi:hypothetical protein D910_04628, partial [Dendroctonus ponderosae]
ATGFSLEDSNFSKNILLRPIFAKAHKIRILANFNEKMLAYFPLAITESIFLLFQKNNCQNDRIPMKCQSGPYSLSPLSASSQRLLRSPHKATRKISRIPFKVLDAPELQDDFYLNLVDWSVQNVLSVGLGSCVYLWSACTSQVTRLCDLSSDANVVTSVSWSERGNLVAVGTHNGYVTVSLLIDDLKKPRSRVLNLGFLLLQVWDVTVNKQVNKLMGHSARVGALAWNGDVLSSGSRDRMILQRDTRTPRKFHIHIPTDNNHPETPDACNIHLTVHLYTFSCFSIHSIAPHTRAQYLLYLIRGEPSWKKY